MQHLGSRKQFFILAIATVLVFYYCYFRTALVTPIYGPDPAAWPYLVDVTFTLPLLYYFLFRPSRKKMLTAWLAIASFGMLAGRLLNPAQEQAFGHYTILLIALEIGLELALVGVLIYQCRQLLKQSHSADDAFATIFTNKPMELEARIWYYGMLMRHGERLHFRGEQHFRYDQNQGNASNQLAWIMLILFETPISHLFLHLWLGTGWLLWTLDLLNLWGLLALIAEYRATRWRPISLDAKALIIRNGVLAGDRNIPYPLIEAVSRCGDEVRHQAGVLIFRQGGQLNVKIQLSTATQLPNLMGRKRPVHTIYLSMDQPAAFVDALRARLVPPALTP
ncbi:hypothetical protein ACFFKC_01110 [Pseudoduganella danionis]|uniref:Uncharacterized protein n=1 Tax=Pseudoduganella danionis TaxID=1890295 RepID=A0ABW9SIV0_9BURK|nr:hypothetical protein [Pseudoduganella danionis]MTW31885.1 hypothetical protein [Pseudoduganella danionis]